MRKLLWFIMLGAIGVSLYVHAQSGDKKLSPQERVKRNYALARKTYDAYNKMAKTGFADSWQADNYAPGWKDYAFSPDEKNERHLVEVVHDNPEAFGKWDAAEYKGVIAALPDLKSATPFAAICGVEGCSYQVNLGGHDKNGGYHEFNESVYFWTNEYGKIYKVENYDDWANITEFFSFIAGKPFCKFDVKAIWDGYARFREEAVKKSL